ncbi:MAG TPA: futalosine hydrolase [Desulfobulbaceae bacterium]|nr:futalosine hydrolase [Desulfobulbaceae bacterium]
MFLIVAATEMEMRAFRKAVSGSLPWEPLVSGIGPVETAFSLTSRLERGRSGVRGVLHFGIAGAYHGSGGNGAEILDICLAEEEILADLGICCSGRIEHFSAPELGACNRFSLDRKLLQDAATLLKKKKIAFHQGRFLTVSCVSGTRKRGDMLADQFDGLCENMEGAAVARVCRAFRLPCLEIRCISNFVEDRDTGRWRLKEACNKAGETAALVADHLIKTQKL